MIMDRTMRASRSSIRPLTHPLRSLTYPWRSPTRPLMHSSLLTTRLLQPSTHPPRPSTHPPHPATHPPRPSTHPPRLSTHPPRPSTHPPRPSTHPPRPSMHPPRPSTHPPRPSTHPPRPSTHPPRPSTHYPRPSMHPPRPSTHPPRPSTHPPRPSMHPPRPSTHRPRPSTQPPPDPPDDSNKVLDIHFILSITPLHITRSASMDRIYDLEYLLDRFDRAPIVEHTSQCSTSHDRNSVHRVCALTIREEDKLVMTLDFCNNDVTLEEHPVLRQYHMCRVRKALKELRKQMQKANGNGNVDKDELITQISTQQPALKLHKKNHKAIDSNIKPLYVQRYHERKIFEDTRLFLCFIGILMLFCSITVEIYNRVL